jgi:hypothetical protein
MPDFMMEWWFLALMSGCLCFFLVLALVMFLVAITALSRKDREQSHRPPGREERP